MFTYALYTLLYGYLVISGTLDAYLVLPALHRVNHVQSVGRLLATLCVLAGIVLSAIGRLFVIAPLSVPVVIGVLLIDAGLTGYAIYLPEQGLQALVRTRRQR